MRVSASAGRDRKKDVKTYVHNMRLVAEDDEEAAVLAAVHELLFEYGVGALQRLVDDAKMWRSRGVKARHVDEGEVSR